SVTIGTVDDSSTLTDVPSRTWTSTELRRARAGEHWMSIVGERDFDIRRRQVAAHLKQLRSCVPGYHDYTDRDWVSLAGGALNMHLPGDPN
ncbi:MAG: hypothetical protein ACRET2_17375, partial [Steroidobacteraceae bacterium]